MNSLEMTHAGGQSAKAAFSFELLAFIPKQYLALTLENGKKRSL
jgi:hypothetical protein